jgi:hypothetical protein
MRATTVGQSTTQTAERRSCRCSRRGRYRRRAGRRLAAAYAPEPDSPALALPPGCIEWPFVATPERLCLAPPTSPAVWPPEPDSGCSSSPTTSTHAASLSEASTVLELQARLGETSPTSKWSKPSHQRSGTPYRTRRTPPSSCRQSRCRRARTGVAPARRCAECGSEAVCRERCSKDSCELVDVVG